MTGTSIQKELSIQLFFFGEATKQRKIKNGLSLSTTRNTS